MNTLTIDLPIPEFPASPLAVDCPYCGQDVGNTCAYRTTGDEKGKPHKQRVARWRGAMEMHIAFTTYMKNGAPFSKPDPGWNDHEAMTMTPTPGTD